MRYGDSGPPAKHDSLLQHDTITINQNNKYSRALLEDDKELKKNGLSGGRVKRQCMCPGVLERKDSRFSNSRKR